MESCSHISRISAYHDGELPDGRRAEVEAHLQHCPQCAAELAELQTMSAMLERMPRRQLDPLGLARLHQQVDSLTDRSLLRFVEMLSGLAAALLVAASVWLVQAPEAAAQPLPAWERAAVTLQTEPANGSQTMQAAEWIVSDLSPGNSDD